MPFQSTVRLVQAFGIIGEVIFDGPQRAAPNILDSADAANNVIGRAFTALAGIDGRVEAGGAGVFAGILINPLAYATAGVAGDALAPTLLLPNETEADFLTMGIIVVLLTTAANIGDDVHFVIATGELLAVAPGTAPAVGNAAVPNAKVSRRNIPAAGLAVITLTN